MAQCHTVKVIPIANSQSSTQALVIWPPDWKQNRSVWCGGIQGMSATNQPTWDLRVAVTVSRLACAVHTACLLSQVCPFLTLVSRFPFYPKLPLLLAPQSLVDPCSLFLLWDDVQSFMSSQDADCVLLPACIFLVCSLCRVSCSTALVPEDITWFPWKYFKIYHITVYLFIVFVCMHTYRAILPVLELFFILNLMICYAF